MPRLDIGFETSPPVTTVASRPPTTGSGLTIVAASNDSRTESIVAPGLGVNIVSPTVASGSGTFEGSELRGTNVLVSSPCGSLGDAIVVVFSDALIIDRYSLSYRSRTPQSFESNSRMQVTVIRR